MNYMNKDITQMQQGDVTFKRIDPPILRDGTNKRVKKGRHVLADGEHTGHSHVIEAEDDATLIRDGERMLLKLTKPATVRHEEHKPVTLPPGVWEVGRVREVDHLSGLTRQVQD